MTEREKMISGALYDPSEAALLAARMDTDWLRRAFGVFLLYVGAKELLAGRK